VANLGRAGTGSFCGEGNLRSSMGLRRRISSNEKVFQTSGASVKACNALNDEMMQGKVGGDSMARGMNILDSIHLNFQCIKASIQDSR
jgi:hypothetical protein